MRTDFLDGYTGIRFGDGQLFYDIILLSVILLLFIFSIIFRYFHPLFIKMGKDLLSLKERQSMFDTNVKSRFFFKGFMQFHAIFLLTAFGFLAYCQYTAKQNYEIETTVAAFAIFFCIVYIYFIIKQLIYRIYGYCFSDANEYKLWATNYDTIFYIWDMALYLPVLWIIFDNKHVILIFIIFLSLYILFRIAVIYITIRIFYNKNTGFLHLSLYLCAQEIIPVLLLYEGLKYLHNIIHTSAIWH